MRNLYKFKWLNDGIRTLNESIVYPEVEQTLNDWKKYSNTKETSVLVGGVALSFYLKPRPTEDLDLIFLSVDDIPDDIYGFKRSREHSFRHIITHVEVKVLDPDFLNKDIELFKIVFNNSILSDDIRVASPKCLIVLKLNRYIERDIADIADLIKYCKYNDIDLNFDQYPLTEREFNNLQNSLNRSNERMSVNFSQNMHMMECVSLMKSDYKISKLDNDIGFDIFVTNEKHETPTFYFGRNVGNRTMKFDDFSYLIKIPENINEELEVLYSSTDYTSFTGRKNEYEVLKKWLSGNLEKLRESYIEINE